MKLSFFSIIAISLWINFTIAQTSDLGSWNIINIKYSHSEKLSFFGEAQLISLKLYNNFHYYEYKGGINYKVHKNVLNLNERDGFGIWDIDKFSVIANSQGAEVLLMDIPMKRP